MCQKGGKAKVRDRALEYQVKTATIANDKRLVLRRIAHIEWKGQGSEVGGSVEDAPAPCKIGSRQWWWPREDLRELRIDDGLTVMSRVADRRCE